jgi:hypothetical protein
MPNIKTTGPWQWCVKENSTYLDCPVAEHPKETSVTIAAFNPAATPMDVVSIVL